MHSACAITTSAFGAHAELACTMHILILKTHAEVWFELVQGYRHRFRVAGYNKSHLHSLEARRHYGSGMEQGYDPLL